MLVGKVNAMRLKILFVIENLSAGGAERVFVNLLNNIDKDKFEPILILVNEGKKGQSYRPPEGIELINLRTKKTKALVPLAKVIKREQPDIVFSSLAPINILCLMVKLLLRDKDTAYIVRETTIKSISVAQTKSNPFVRFLYLKLIQIFYPHADSIVALSNGSKQDLVENFKIDEAKIRVIYNPVDIQSVVDKSLEEIGEMAPSEESTLICVGSLVKSKGHVYLIEAMHELINKRQQKVRLLILGVGDLENSLRALVAKYDLADSIEFLGFQENPFKYMKNSDVFVLPAIWEGFGNVIVEAMACGVPVISTTCESGPKEIIEHGRTGLLVEKANARALSDAIQMLILDREYADFLSINAVSRANDFDVSRITLQYEAHISSVYRNIVEGR